MDKLTDLAQFFKDRDNPNAFDITTAEVIKLDPITLKLSEKIFLSKEYGNLVMSAGLIKDNERKVIATQVTATTNSVLVGVSSHAHTLDTFSATLKTVDNDFKIGDKLIVIPISNGEIWYAMDCLGVF